MFGKRDPYLVCLTIHTITVPVSETDLFQLEWKCGHNKSLTDRVIPVDRVVSYEKPYRFTATFTTYKDGSVKPKSLSIKVKKQTLDGKNKNFAWIVIDLAPYVTAGTPLARQIALESLHQEKSTLTLAISVKKVDYHSPVKSGLLSEGSLTSESEALRLSTDHTTSWDVSDTFKPEDVQRFMTVRHEVRAELMRLSDFEKGSEQRQRSKKRRAARVPGLTTAKEEENAQKLSVFFMSTKGPRDSDREKPAGLYLSSRKALNIVGLVTKFDWCKSPIQIVPYCLPASVFYAVFVKFSVFDTNLIGNSDFEQIMDAFFENTLSTAKHISSHYDSLIKSIYLLALITKLQNVEDGIRQKLFIKRMKRVIDEQIHALAVANCASFKDLTEKYLKENFDGTISYFTMLYNRIARKDLPEEFQKLVIAKTTECLEHMLLRHLIDNPEVNNFMNATLWNTFITRLECELPDFTKMPLFRQANTVLLLSESICADPGCSSDICPDLPKNIIMKILQNQQPDELRPVSTDTRLFEKMFETEIRDEIDLKITPCHDQLSAVIEEIDISGWRDVILPNEAFDNFDFLSEFFTRDND